RAGGAAHLGGAVGADGGRGVRRRRGLAGSMSAPRVRSIGITEAAYSSKFSGWHSLASVRTKPRRQVAEEEPSEHVYFPPELVPASQHPLVVELGAETVERVLIQNLHTYLEFTSELEHGAVNPVAAMISRRRSGFDLPETMI